ncbi:MAG: MFS transporter [Clostridia bacterium]|nr:MFS transporter [Clostridia bacterium]
MKNTVMPNIEKDVNIHLENKYESRAFFWFLWILYAVVSMTKNCYNGALASIVSEGILTKSQTGFISAMFFAVYAPLQIGCGFVADKFSPERIIKIGLIGAAISNIIIFFNQNYYVMLAAWIFNGIIQFGIWPSIFKIVSSQLVRSERTQMASYISFAASFGYFLSYIVAAVVPSWEYNFSISAASLLIFAVLLHIFEKHLNPYMKWDKIEKVEAKTKTDIPATKIFAKSGFYFVLISSFLAIIVSQSRSSLNSVMLFENYDNISPSLGNILTSVFIICGILATIIAKKFAGKMKNEMKTMIIIYAAMLPFLSACILVGKIQVSFVIIAMCFVACFESVANLAKNYYTMHFIKYGLNGTAAGILNGGAGFSYVIAGYIIPLIIENFGWRATISLWSLLIVATIIVILLGLKTFNAFTKNGI